MQRIRLQIAQGCLPNVYRATRERNPESFTRSTALSFVERFVATTVDSKTSLLESFLTLLANLKGLREHLVAASQYDVTRELIDILCPKYL